MKTPIEASPIVAAPRVPATASPPIRFGTDGWRALIAEDYTFENVRWAARAVARYLLAQGKTQRDLIVGYDCRFLSQQFAEAAAQEAASAGLPVLLADSFAPTPAIAFAVRSRRAAGAIMITASHNPWRWNGFKFKASYGGSAAPEIIRQIEAELPAAAAPNPGADGAGRLKQADLLTDYLEHLGSVVNLGSIAQSGMSFVFDPLFGAARGCFPRLCAPHGVRCQEIHREADPLFGGLNPEPIEPHVAALQQRVLETGADAGFATDGDADRVGAVDRGGRFVDSHRIFAILLKYLVEARGMRGAVVKTFSTTKLVDRLAHKYSLPLYETPIGFKYICDRMLSTDVLIGGEESGGIGVPALGGPERDGVLNALLLAQAMAHYGKSLGDLVAELHREFGPQHYGRADLTLASGQKERAMQVVSAPELKQFCGFTVLRREDLDGIKLYLENGAWLLVRPSGTEPLLRIYAEAGEESIVREVLLRAEEAIRSL